MNQLAPASLNPTAAYQFTPSQEKLLLFVLAAIQFTHVLDFVIIMPLSPQLMRTFAITPQAFSLLVSVYTVSSGVAGFIGSFFIDRFDRKSALLTLYIGFAVGTLACAVAPDYYFFLAARTLAGVFGGILSALLLVIIGDTIPEARRGAATGQVMAAFSVASVVGIPFGLYLANLLSWHAPFVLLVVACAVVLPLAYRVLPPMAQHLRAPSDRNPLQNLADIARDANLRWALSLMVMINFAAFFIIPFLAQYMVANVGLRENQLTYIYLFGGALTFFTSPYVGRLSDRYGKPRVFLVMAILSLFPMLAIANLPAAPLWVVLTITTLFFIMNGGRYVPATAMVTSSVSSGRRGSFMSLSSAAQSLAAGASAFLAGLVISENADKSLRHFDRLGWISAVMVLACIFVSRFVRPAPTN